MTIVVGKGQMADWTFDRRWIAMAVVMWIAATAPLHPDTVLIRGLRSAELISLLCWREVGVLDLLAGALALWAGAGALDTWNVWQSSLATTNWWTCIAVFVAVRSALTGRRQLILAAVAYLIGCVRASNVIIQQILEKGIDLKVGAGGEAVRLGVDGVNANYTAYALATGTAVAAMLLHLSLPKLVRILVVATIPVMGYATIGTGTRGVQVSVVLVCAYLLLFRLLPRTAWTIAVAGVPGLLLTVALGVYGDGNLLWIQEYFNRQTSDLSGRTDLWPAARAVWAEHPLTGAGPGMFPLLNSMNIGAHSLVLTLGAELGLIGLSLFAAVVASALRSAAGEGSHGRRLAGLLLVAWAPIWMSGHWELSPAAWVVLAAWSRLPSAIRADAGR